MTRKTVLLHSEKGGTGKTTLACLYAAYRAVLGDRVLLIDADGQAHATMTLGLEDAPGLYECLVRGAAIESQARRPLLDTWVPDGYDPAGELHVLPGNDETYLVPMKVGWHENRLGDLLDGTEYDLVVIDTGPSGGGLMSILWSVASGVVIPTLLDPLSVAATVKTVGRAHAAGVPVLAVVPNMVNMQTVLHQTYYADLADTGWPVFEPIASRIEWGEASHLRMQLYSVEAQMSKARIEALRFCRGLDRVRV